MATAKRLNLSKTSDDESLSVLSSDDEQEKHQTKQTLVEEDEISSDEESDEDFEIPPGFESVKGKLPKNLDASALANVTIKVNETKDVVTPGELVAKVTVGKDEKKYLLQSEDRMLTDQLVNALPLASNRARFVLGKPFSRCFSLVEDHVDASPVVSKKKATKVVTASPVEEKRKKKHSSDNNEKHKVKKAKHKK
ncbi:unnamed protein product [Peronospora destructor]|uniref:Uncharacterized protein n=1 Tax=Peronospora destructor TaxID=86335 RepID=A0AAV0VA56_9STRA|nr:unnamed protein product [Peronospora destructor]